MARKKRKKPGRPPKKKERGFIFDEKVKPETFWGVMIVLQVLIAIIMLLSLANIAGALGEYLKRGLKIVFGFSAYLVPFMFIWGAAAVLRSQRSEEGKVKKVQIVGLLLLFLSLTGILHSFTPVSQYLQTAQRGSGGGYVGYMVTFPLESVVGVWAGVVILLAIGAIGVLLFFNTSFTEMMDFGNQLVAFVQRIISKITKRKEIKEAGLRVKGLDGKNESIDDYVQEKIVDNTPIKDKKKKPKTYEVVEDDSHQVNVSSGDEDFKPYSLDLLDKKSAKPVSGDIRANARIIEETLKSFGIGVTMEEVNIGPTVTQYTFKPHTGVKLSQITTLHNDLSLALAAFPLRIEAPIPGKSLVGVEIPNKTVALVTLREVLASKEFNNDKAKLTVGLGRDVSGSVVSTDIATMPHLLIAGATGSGKSVGIHTLILSLLYKHSPSSLKLILVDPKKVELPSYNGIPHLLTPAITESDKTISALKWAVVEMEKRFLLLSEKGKRDIISYNQAFPKEKLPYIVIVIDELADLMAVAANEVEAAVVRLAQMSRAVGIHLVLATQRPSVNVITGLIKANIPARVAFTVASQIDSRTIIDSSGAEKLLGKGDMLYVASDLGKSKRVQGAYISEKEIKKIVDYLKSQGEPEYDEDIIKQKVGQPGKTMGASASDDDQDELFEEAKQLVIQAGKASASLLQRRLKVGYARAARLLDSLEEHGIVGPPEGAKPREVYVEAMEPTPLDPPPDQSNEF